MGKDLSANLMKVFRENNKTRIKKEARELIREQVLWFEREVERQCSITAEIVQRKTYTLPDVVNATVKVWRAVFPGSDALAAIQKVFLTGVEGDAPFKKDELPATDRMYATTTLASGATKTRVISLNTLQLGEVTAIFKTVRAAAKDANSFMARVADEVALELLARSLQACTAAKAKQVTEEHVRSVAGDPAAAAAPAVVDLPSPPPPDPTMIAGEVP